MYGLIGLPPGNHLHEFIVINGQLMLGYGGSLKDEKPTFIKQHDTNLNFQHTKNDISIIVSVSCQDEI
jgi:hypothetical protein